MATYSGGDIVISLSHAMTCFITQGFHTIIHIGQKTVGINCHQDGEEKVFIKVVGLPEVNPYDGFDYMSILDGDNKILSLNQISLRSKRGITVPIEKYLVQKEGLYIFKILFAASTRNGIPLPRTTYPFPPNTLVVSAPALPMETVGPIPFVAPAAATSASPMPGIEARGSKLASSPIERGRMLSSADQMRSNSADEDGKNARHAPHGLTSHSSHETITNPALSLTPTQPNSPPLLSEDVQDSQHDVHFYHYDRTKDTSNIIKARHEQLKPYPILSQLVSDNMVVKPRVVGVSVSPPLTVVNISRHSLPAFKVLMDYINGQDISGILSNSPFFQCSVTSETVGSGQATIAVDLNWAQHIGEILRLAHLFDIYELIHVCVVKLCEILNADGALQFLQDLRKHCQGLAYKYVSDHQVDCTESGCIVGGLNELILRHPQQRH
ncbi:hypothetical protein BGX28_008799 [Mortierella sp. GBA30]|nr:hypothetical protein BGX28_008799 [Mortierella sp. GBA30]